MTYKTQNQNNWKHNLTFRETTSHIVKSNDYSFINFDNVRSSFMKRQVMFPVVMVLYSILKIFRCSEHYAPKRTYL